MECDSKLSWETFFLSRKISRKKKLPEKIEQDKNRICSRNNRVPHGIHLIRINHLKLNMNGKKSKCDRLMITICNNNCSPRIHVCMRPHPHMYVHAAVYVINKLVRIFINHLNVYRSMWSTTTAPPTRRYTLHI